MVSPTEAEIGTKKARELQNTIMKWALDAQVDRRHHDRTSDEDTDSVSTIDSVDLDSLPAPVRRRPPGSQANSQTVGGTSMASSVSGSSRGKKKKRLSVTFTAGGNLQFSRKRSIPKSSTAASDVGGRDNDLDDEFAPEELRAIEDVLGAGGHGQRSNPRSQRDNASNRPETVPESDLEGFDLDEMSIIHNVLGTAGDARQQPCEPARKVSRADSPKNGANSPSVLSGIEHSSDDDLDAEELAIIAAYLGHAPQKPGLREGHPADETTNQHQAAVAPKTSAPAQTAGLGGIFAMSRSKKSRARPWLPPPKSFTPVPQRDDALRSSPSRPEANGVGGAADVQETKFPMTEDVPTDSTEPQSPLHRDRSAFPSASTFAVPDDWNPSEASHSSGVFAVEQDEMGVMHPDLRRALDLITEQSGSVDAWKAKAEGLRLIVVMIDCHTDAVLSVREQIVAAVCPEITNARASIAKLAIDTASSLCKVAGPALDSSVDSIVCALLKHGAPDKAFVNAAAESALTDAALHMTPEAVFVALLEGLRKKSNKTKALAAHALLTVLERFEPSLVPSFAAEVLPRLPPLLRSPERPAGVTLLKALVVVDGWDDALVDRYLTGDGLHIVLSCMNDMRSSHTKVSPRGKTRSSEPQSSSLDRPSGTYRASSVSSRVSKPTGGSTGGKEWTTLMRIKTEIAQSTDWQKRDAALGILDIELSDPAKYTRHVEIIFRDILLPLTTVSNGKLQVSFCAYSSVKNAYIRHSQFSFAVVSPRDHYKVYCTIQNRS